MIVRECFQYVLRTIISTELHAGTCKRKIYSEFRLRVVPLAPAHEFIELTLLFFRHCNIIGVVHLLINLPSFG